MKQILIFVLAFMLVEQSCAQKKGNNTKENASSKDASFNLSGKIPVAQAKENPVLVYLKDLDSEPIGADTLKINAKTGEFSQKIKMTENVGLYVLIIGQWQNVFIPAKNKDIITLTHKELAENPKGTWEVKGSEDTKKVIAYGIKEQELQQKHIKPLETRYQAAVAANNEVEIAKIQEEFMTKIAPMLKKEMNAYVFENFLGSFATVFLAYRWDTESEPLYMEKLNTPFQKAFGKEAIAKSINERYESFSKLGVGGIAPEISEMSPDGKKIALSSLRGKYVLLDFWAAWCGPCRQENPNVVAAYEKYKSKGFTVYGVSLDDNKDAWIKAIEKDKLTWSNVSDLKKWSSTVGKLYAIKGIPMNFLLDKEGKIIAKNLRGKALEDKLAEVLK